jgi:hypothetical protein
MSLWPLVAVDVPTPGSLEQTLIRLLAVAGGAALGGIGSGVVTRVLTRLLTTKAVPPSVLRVIRLLGAIALGLITAVLLFGTGGGLGGGGGGWGLFGGSGSGEGTGKGGEPPAPTGRAPSTARDPTTAKETSRGDTGRRERPGTTALRVEVLGDARVEGNRFYRVEGEARLRNLDEVRELVKAGLKEVPPLKELVVVVYKNSPDEQKYQVVELKRLASDFGLTASVELPPRDAP